MFEAPLASNAPGKGERIHDVELEAPITDVTRKALLKDADLFQPVKNADGSMTYTLLEEGITDRPGSKSNSNYFSRKIDITVPQGKPSLEDCQFNFSPRENISKERFDQLLSRNKNVTGDVILHTHGVFTSEKSADQEALMLQLSSGLPTVNIDWAAHPIDGSGTLKSLFGYERDRACAMRANRNKSFEKAIDSTIDSIGASNTEMIGFSHGAMFDTRYLKHRVDNNLAPLDTVILNHPDVAIGASELYSHENPDVLKRASNHAFVIGSQNDERLKSAEKVDKLLGIGLFHPVERIGDDSNSSRALIKSEGALPIKDVDQPGASSNHFLNYAGISHLLHRGNTPADQLQRDFNNATAAARQK